ncbi:MAG: EthD domain-containing protein [Gammaproteobacteria bacterium]|nr:EthD domain-containing protein [Gammaproteobacteria bacterium]MBT4493851.1 EthD domain-containing protein [Gammaproteobacteria bacterium]
MIKLVMPMKRRPGMSIPEFREYYETKHRVIGEKYLKGFATRYLRRFLDPLPDREGNLSDPEYDVILEIWYPDEETYRACGVKLSEPAVVKEIKEDEEKLFDLRTMRSYLVDECESDLS